MGSLLHRFLSDRQGAVAILFGIALIPLVVAVGAAIDYSRAVNVRTKIQGAIDAAALAAASSLNATDAERIALAQSVFDANFPVGVTGIDVDPDIRIENDAVVVTVDAALPTAIMNIAGISTLDVATTTEVKIPTMIDGEIVLVLDYSMSMQDNNKYKAMREAAVDMINTLSKNGANDKIKVGLVPFSGHVYLSLPKEYVIHESGNGTWTNCTKDRMWPYNITDATPDPDKDETKWGPQGIASPKNILAHLLEKLAFYLDCSKYASRNLIVRPLTNDIYSVVNQLQGMEAFNDISATGMGMTHISLGLEMGWHLISPNAPFTEGVPYGDEDTVKAIVLLTDGDQTEGAWGENGTRNKYNGEANLETMCEAIKDQKVLLVTVAFDLKHNATKNRLRNCATSTQHFYEADSNTDLADAFRNITGQLTKAIYISR